MAKRGQNQDSVYFDPSRDRWVGAVSLGFGPDSRRRRRKVYGKTKSAVYDKLRELHRNLDKGVVPRAGYSVNDSLDDWLSQGRNRVSESTRATERYLAEHLRRTLGKARLRDLTARDVHMALDSMTGTHSTRTIHLTRNVLQRAIRLAEANDLVGRNVAALVTPPAGTDGRESKSLTMSQAVALLEAARTFPAMHAYIVLSLLSGLRTEEVRALRWEDVDLHDGVVYVLRSVRAGGDTKTRKSRRALKLPQLAHDALRGQVLVQARMRQEAGDLWQEHGLVFASVVGTPRLAGNVRRDFRKVLGAVDGLDPDDWTPRELRHSFVSLTDPASVRQAPPCGRPVKAARTIIPFDKCAANRHLQRTPHGCLLPLGKDSWALPGARDCLRPMAGSWLTPRAGRLPSPLTDPMPARPRSRPSPAGR